jgi:hypothetical protein
MSYENAPATKLVATDCCVCGRPLVDSESVEAGIGPVCRTKYLMADSLTKTARKKANKLVYQAAALRSNGQPWDHLIPKLIALGAVNVARAVSRAKVEVAVEENGDFFVTCPYNQTFLGRTRGLSGRQWDRTGKRTKFAATAKADVWDAICEAYPQAVIDTPKGTFHVGSLIEG